jgi:hypothetical protein
MKKLMRIVETDKGSVELKKGTSDSEIKKYTDKGIDVQLVDPATEKLEEEAGKKYTTQESAAVGKEVARSLVKVLRAQGNELKNIKLTGLGVNKFNIHVEYGQDKGQDTFRFTLNPDTKSIHLDLGNEDQELVDFIITQGNEVSFPTPQLEDKLADAMVKYVSGPSDEEYDDMAAMQTPTDPSQFAKELNEKKLTKPELKKREDIVKAMKKEGEPKDARTYAIATAQAKKLAEGVKDFFEDPMHAADVRGYLVNPTLSDSQKRDKIKAVMKDPSKFNELMNAFTDELDKVKNRFSKKVTEKLDPVGKEDKDINNDGKVDSTDKYLGKRRQAISQNIDEITNPELTKYVNRFVGGLASKYDYSTQDAVYAIMQVLRSQGWKGINEDLDIGHQDNEPAMLKKDVYRIAKMASMLYKELDKFDNGQEVDFPHWWQAKIIKAYDYLQAAYGYLDAEQKVQQIDNTVVTTMTLNEKKGTCCHKCGHVHVKGTSHPTPYLTGKNNCKFRD